MSRELKDFGDWGEDLAAGYLKKLGSKILGAKVRTRIGEVDILAQDGDTIIVVEVKAKADVEKGTPEEMVNWKKQRKLIRLAHQVNQKFPNFKIRIDVVAIEGNDIRYYKNAVQEN